MSHVLYPTVLPVDCAMDIVSMITNGTIKDNVPAFALHLWNIQGYVQFAILGLPPGNLAAAAMSMPADEDQMITLEGALESFVQEADRGSTFGASPADTNLDPATILMLIQMATQVIELIKKLRNRK